MFGTSYLCHVCYDRPFLTSHRQCAACLQVRYADLLTVLYVIATLISVLADLQSTCMSCLSRHQLFKLDPRTKRPLERRFCRLCVEVVLSASSDDESVDLSSSRAIVSIQSHREPEPVASTTTPTTEMASLVRRVSATKWSTAVAAMTPAPDHPRSQIEPMRSQPEEIASLGRSPSVNCIADLASLTRSTRQPPTKKIVSLRSKHRRGGSCRFPSSNTSAPTSATTTESTASTATKSSVPPSSRDGTYTFFRPLEECLNPRDDSIQLADLVLSTGSNSGRLVSSFKQQRRSGKGDQTFTIDTINSSSVSTSRVSTTAFAPGLSQFELEVDLSAVLRAAGADLGDEDEDDSSVSDANLRSLSPRMRVLVTSSRSSRGHVPATRGTNNKSSFLADLYSLSLSMSPR